MLEARTFWRRPAAKLDHTLAFKSSTEPNLFIEACLELFTY